MTKSNENRELTEKERLEHDSRIKRINRHSERWNRVKEYEKLPCKYFEEMGE